MLSMGSGEEKGEEDLKKGIKRDTFGEYIPMYRQAKHVSVALWNYKLHKATCKCVDIQFECYVRHGSWV